jgi:hypothetical protein
MYLKKAEDHFERLINFTQTVFENVLNIGTFRVRGRSVTLSKAKLDESNE